MRAYDTITDYHVHIERGPYTAEWLETFVAAAHKAGVTELGISEHAYRFHQTKHLLWNPWVARKKTEDLEAYLGLLLAARARGIPLKIGIEMDYMPDNAAAMRRFLAEHPFDYAIGSVHWLGGFGFDLDEMRGQWEQGNVEEIHDTYFSVLEQMIEERPVDIIGHADVIKVFGFHAPRVAMNWYRRLTPKIKASGMAVEVSTAGWRKPVRELYPAPEWLAMLVEADVPLVLSSDAHRPEDVGAGYPQALDLLRALGVRRLHTLTSRVLQPA
ncbi:MAG: histidinol-phosphatase [Candidatus Sericytochromatia bacterium]|nr:histidinol-phosphatase [Candidatus Sericytochromatia bacterium]